MFKTHCYVDWKLSCDILVMHVTSRSSSFKWKFSFFKAFLTLIFASFCRWQAAQASFKNNWAYWLNFHQTLKNIFEETWHNLSFAERPLSATSNILSMIAKVYTKQFFSASSIPSDCLKKNRVHKPFFCPKWGGSKFALFRLRFEFSTPIKF